MYGLRQLKHRGWKIVVGGLLGLTALTALGSGGGGGTVPTPRVEQAEASFPSTCPSTDAMFNDGWQTVYHYHWIVTTRGNMKGIYSPSWPGPLVPGTCTPE